MLRSATNSRNTQGTDALPKRIKSGEELPTADQAGKVTLYPHGELVVAEKTTPSFIH